MSTLRRVLRAGADSSDLWAPKAAEAEPRPERNLVICGRAHCAGRPRIDSGRSFSSSPSLPRAEIDLKLLMHFCHTDKSMESKLEPAGMGNVDRKTQQFIPGHKSGDRSVSGPFPRLRCPQRHHAKARRVWRQRSLRTGLVISNTGGALGPRTLA